MKQLLDLLGKRVTIVSKDVHDIEGTLLSVGDGGYFIEDDDGTFIFMPEANNVLEVIYNKPE